jgi:Heavy-metal resistance protein CzcE
MKNKYTFAAALILSCASLSAMAGNGTGAHLSLLGDPAPASAAGRVIKLDANTHYVNVTQGETVQFIAANGKSATWTFDSTNRTAVKLQKIMPAGSLDHPIMAYVEPDLENEPNS